MAAARAPASDGSAAAAAEGLVVATHGRHCEVETASGERVRCHSRGKRGAAVVGDRVRWSPAGDEGVIDGIAERRNLLYRRDEWRTKAFAANLDQVLVLVCGMPMFGESQLARALIASAEAHVPALVVLNKIDQPEAASARERLAFCGALGTDLVETSLRESPQEAAARLGPRLDGRVTLVLGASGSGKSTLVNAFAEGAGAATGDISEALSSGRHTTTATRWYWLSGERRGALIDSPGFQEFGLHHVEAADLARWMPDVGAHAAKCRFYNCTHRDEPGCAVRESVDQGTLDASRYRVYRALYEELDRR